MKICAETRQVVSNSERNEDEVQRVEETKLNPLKSQNALPLPLLKLIINKYSFNGL